MSHLIILLVFAVLATVPDTEDMGGSITEVRLVVAGALVAEEEVEASAGVADPVVDLQADMGAPECDRLRNFKVA